MLVYDKTNNKYYYGNKEISQEEYLIKKEEVKRKISYYEKLINEEITINEVPEDIYEEIVIMYEEYLESINIQEEENDTEIKAQAYDIITGEVE